jgi:hypothetical protein
MDHNSTTFPRFDVRRRLWKLTSGPCWVRG